MLDTSFWTVGFKVGLLGYAMRTFSIVVPRAVEDEIRSSDTRYPQRLYPDTALFDQVHDQLHSPEGPEPDPLDSFGTGEAAAIALSLSIGAPLLINDRRPAEYARNLGIPVVSVPGTVVVARSQDLIASHMAQAMVRMCGQHGTAQSLIREAAKLLAVLDAI